MSQAPRLAAQAAGAFAQEARARAPLRIEARVESADGMPLLCAVEAALREAFVDATVRRELVWVTGAPADGGEVLRLRAYGAGGEVVGEGEWGW